MTTKVTVSNTGHIPVHVQRGTDRSTVLGVGECRDITLWKGDDGKITITETEPEVPPAAPAASA